MSNYPLMSVVMPVYNCEAYVKEAVDSMLAQEYPNLEIICIDDGSTDNSRDVLRSYKDRICLVTSDVNEGIAQARNKGIAVARGEYIALMDADDIASPERLMVQYEYLLHHAEVAMVFGKIECFLSPDLDEEIKKIRYCPSEPIEGYISPTALIRASVFREIGGFDPKWRVGEFIDWFARAKDRGLLFGSVPQTVIKRRIHATNTGVVQRDARVDYLRIVRETLKRKRNEKDTGS